MSILTVTYRYKYGQSSSLHQSRNHDIYETEKDVTSTHLLVVALVAESG